MVKIFTLENTEPFLCEERVKQYHMTLPEILEYINRDRSEEWTDYDLSDWREGLSEWTTFKVIEG